MTDGITLASRVQTNEDVVFHDLEGELVLLNLKTGVYFGLDPMGTKIWQLIQEHQLLKKILDSLVEEYEVTKARCEQELLGFVAGLRENKLIEVDD